MGEAAVLEGEGVRVKGKVIYIYDKYIYDWWAVKNKINRYGHIY